MCSICFSEAHIHRYTSTTNPVTHTPSRLLVDPSREPVGLSPVFDVACMNSPHCVHSGCPHEDREEVGACHHREVLLSPDHGLPHEQAGVRRGCHHPVQADAEQDRWLCDPPHEAYSEGPCERHFAQASGGGARAAYGLRPRGMYV